MAATEDRGWWCRDQRSGLGGNGDLDGGLGLGGGMDEISRVGTWTRAVQREERSRSRSRRERARGWTFWAGGLLGAPGLGWAASRLRSCPVGTWSPAALAGGGSWRMPAVRYQWCRCWRALAATGGAGGGRGCTGGGGGGGEGALPKWWRWWLWWVPAAWWVQPVEGQPLREPMVRAGAPWAPLYLGVRSGQRADTLCRDRAEMEERWGKARCARCWSLHARQFEACVPQHSTKYTPHYFVVQSVACLSTPRNDTIVAVCCHRHPPLCHCQVRKQTTTPMTTTITTKIRARGCLLPERPQ